MSIESVMLINTLSRGIWLHQERLPQEGEKEHPAKRTAFFKGSMKGNLAGPRLLKVDQVVVRCLLDEAKEVCRARGSEDGIKDSGSC